jgi:hypothetical protein
MHKILTVLIVCELNKGSRIVLLRVDSHARAVGEWPQESCSTTLRGEVLARTRGIFIMLAALIGSFSLMRDCRDKASVRASRARSATSALTQVMSPGSRARRVLNIAVLKIRALKCVLIESEVRSRACCEVERTSDSGHPRSLAGLRLVAGQRRWSLRPFTGRSLLSFQTAAFQACR